MNQNPSPETYRLSDDERSLICHESVTRRRARDEAYAQRVSPLLKQVVGYVIVASLGIGLGIHRMHGHLGQGVALVITLLAGTVGGAVFAFIYLLDLVRAKPELVEPYFRTIQARVNEDRDATGHEQGCVFCNRTIGLPDAAPGECPLCRAEVPPTHSLWPHLERAETTAAAEAQNDDSPA